MKKDFLYVVLASALPALGNFIAVAVALRHLDPDWLGKSYALLAFFYVTIDLFNFGSPRIFTVERIRSRVSTLIFLDFASATGSTIVFASLAGWLARTGLFAEPHYVWTLIAAPACYGLSHFSLGVLRLYGRSGLVCLVSTISALSRVGVVLLVIVVQHLRPMLPDLLLLVEAAYGAMLLLAYLATARGGNARPADFASYPNAERFNPWTFRYREFLSENRKEILGSWYSNAIFSGAKHVDIMIVTFILGPSAAALYRGVKSVHNLAFNSGQAFALVVSGKLTRAIAPLLRMRAAAALAGSAIAIALLTLSSWIALRIHLFPTSLLGAPVAQFGFLFAAFLGAGVIFVCRIFSLHVFSIDRRSFVRISSLEVAASLLFVSALSYVFGLIGATSGIALAGAIVLVLSTRIRAKPATACA
ncbi:hypothetical protein EN871_07890 [bacterium M00.F.Ca.ET.228.01.1.1]|uniref:hypothetical protein n=1 Tax=Paraburkholderia phenoliruptrix TaxID=252970 RepID=UPI00109311E1|nr:hypothetical protein [Paraburkholderia phenoliruptrix]TGP46353.1 hypothetical protein EN871_07890 [bacterium M00.F.Ca.ET.228.01.1.1]TGS03733.1 hypothetical protein EN834_05095 [bacterium M00.F.Ca.ET.191.01.1.1]TGU07647.1 hypothetical protein EN798_11965 [bacterium M00.F.Ca.ET.155.01.1.1]MBW0446230.1 hypothetical protein [Paraburkholderia phenoliruptrix]MBW9096653.1 hypothetical protein [Paraburkholderia phenoliruptrix]